MRSVIPRILAMQHRMNPLHVYCRFVERGYRRDASVFYCRVYEITVFSWMSRILRGGLFVACGCRRAGRGTLLSYSSPPRDRKPEAGRGVQ